MEKDYRFRTFHVLNKDHKEIGRITAVKQQDVDGKYLVAFAFCSPKDHYHKKFGQMVALGRLAHRPSKRYVTFNGSVQELKDMALAVAEMKGIGWIEKHKEVILV